MNTIYLDGNYIIFDTIECGEPIRKVFPRTNSYYDEEKDSFVIKKLSGSNDLIIPYKEADSWQDNFGIFFTEESLRSFLRVNTDFKAALGGSSALRVAQIQDSQSLFVDGVVIGDLAYASNSEGTQWLPGTLGGTYYPKGWYVWNGTDWVSDRNAIANQLENNILKIAENDLEIAQEIIDREDGDQAIQQQVTQNENDINTLFGNNIVPIVNLPSLP